MIRIQRNWKKFKFIFKMIRFSGLPFIFRNTFQRNRVTIILFHDIGREQAEMAFGKLRKLYNIISLEDYIAACLSKNKSAIPKKAMIITFDDGHYRNYEILPVVKKYNIPVTIFICASIIGTNRRYWVNHVPNIFEYTSLTNSERLEALKRVGFEQEKEFEHPEAISKNQIEEMKGYIDLQSHTRFHPVLPRCSDIEAEDEIAGSKKILEEDFGLKIFSFAYPNGDYSERDIDLCKKAGYSCALSIDYGFNDINSDIFRLKRIGTRDTDDLSELIVRVSGLWAFFTKRNGKKQHFGYTKNVNR
jgi:poly-beta-1,6-N-acetyl-D-glucosamine N-deacetylase